MARLRKSRKSRVSLFPFLDILACVIGNLILIITAVVLEQIDTEPVAEAARIKEVTERAGGSAEELAELQRQLARARKRSGEAEARLEAVRARIRAATKERQEAEMAVSQPDKPAEDPTIAAEIRRLEKEKRSIEEEITKVTARIAERRKKPEQSIVVLPPGEGGPSRGIFIEASGSDLIVLEGKQPWKLPAGKADTDPRFKKLLADAKADGDTIITFLVRSDGLAAFTRGQRAAEAAGVPSGKVPLPGDGMIDLSKAK